MQVVFSLSQLQYFQFSTAVRLHKKNKETQKFCPSAPIFHLAPYLIFTATLKSIIPESLVLVTKNEQFGVKSAHIRPTIINNYTLAQVITGNRAGTKTSERTS